MSNDAVSFERNFLLYDGRVVLVDAAMLKRRQRISVPNCLEHKRAVCNASVPFDDWFVLHYRRVLRHIDVFERGRWVSVHLCVFNGRKLPNEPMSSDEWILLYNVRNLLGSRVHKLAASWR